MDFRTHIQDLIRVILQFGPLQWLYKYYIDQNFIILGLSNALKSKKKKKRKK